MNTYHLKFCITEVLSVIPVVIIYDAHTLKLPHN